MKISKLSSKEVKDEEAIKLYDIRDGIFKLIKNDFPIINLDDYITFEELNKYRRLYLVSIIENEQVEIDKINNDVIQTFSTNTFLSEKLQIENEAQLTIGQKLADKIASFGGSWTFIIAFFSFISLWILINITNFYFNIFDPFPFILLNLILSCLAAIQAPIIMMSQNRKEQKDRVRSEQDYKINLKAELEIKLLNEKIDHLLIYQNKKLLEIQAIQVDYLEEIIQNIKEEIISSKSKV